MKLAIRLVLCCLRNKILFKAQHTQGKLNILTDKLSRFQFQQAGNIAPNLSPVQTFIPSHLLQIWVHLQAALSTSSRCSYQRSWHLFLKWKPSYTSLPISQVDICNFIWYLFSENYSPSSVSSHVSAIGYLFKIRSLPDPTEKVLPKKLLKGCHALASGQDARLPITVYT